ncbi:hypothetical protein F4604DRAFT_150270 [Suillus subluteus]|nr:hypothetical protein F4604DRAFT_150270 [Suillus subluteus]
MRYATRNIRSVALITSSDRSRTCTHRSASLAAMNIVVYRVEQLSLYDFPNQCIYLTATSPFYIVDSQGLRVHWMQLNFPLLKPVTNFVMDESLSSQERSIHHPCDGLLQRCSQPCFQRSAHIVYPIFQLRPVANIGEVLLQMESCVLLNDWCHRGCFRMLSTIESIVPIFGPLRAQVGITPVLLQMLTPITMCQVLRARSLVGPGLLSNARYYLLHE